MVSRNVFGITLLLLITVMLLLLTAPSPTLSTRESTRPEVLIELREQIREMQKLVSQTPRMEQENEALLYYLDGARTELEKKLTSLALLSHEDEDPR